MSGINPFFIKSSLIKAVHQRRSLLLYSRHYIYYVINISKSNDSIILFEDLLFYSFDNSWYFSLASLSWLEMSVRRKFACWVVGLWVSIQTCFSLLSDRSYCWEIHNLKNSKLDERGEEDEETGEEVGTYYLMSYRC